MMEKVLEAILVLLLLFTLHAKATRKLVGC